MFLYTLRLEAQRVGQLSRLSRSTAMGRDHVRQVRYRIMATLKNCRGVLAEVTFQVQDIEDQPPILVRRLDS